MPRGPMMVKVMSSFFEVGDEVVVTSDYYDMRGKIKKGTRGHLLRLCRVQDGLEVWELGVGRLIRAVTHTNIELARKRK